MNTSATTPGREVTAADIARWAAAADNTPAGLAAALDTVADADPAPPTGTRAIMRALLTGALPATIGPAAPTGADLDAISDRLAADPGSVTWAEQHAISIAHHTAVIAALTPADAR